MLVVRIIDALFDIWLGAMIDKVKTRWGKFRPFLLSVPYLMGELPLYCFMLLICLKWENCIRFWFLFTPKYSLQYCIYTSCFRMTFVVTNSDFDSRTIPESNILLRCIPKLPFGAAFLDPRKPPIITINTTALSMKW